VIEKLLDYAKGALGQVEAEAVRRHAAHCADCGDQLAALILLSETRTLGAPAAAHQAEIVNFPIAPPAQAPRRLWAGAAAILAALAVGAFVTQAGLPGADGPAVSEPQIPAVLFQATEADHDLVAGAVDFLDGIYTPRLRQAAVGTLSDTDRIRQGLIALRNDDAEAAAAVLAPFGERWDNDGTALLGSALFLLENPTAGPVLEMYAAASPRAAAGELEADGHLALYFLARLRYAGGEVAQAQEALGWILPDGAVGRAASAWWATVQR
jgi:hypothetical protein